MSILQTFSKQPGEKQDYDIDFNPWLLALSDTAVSINVTVDAGITLVSSNLSSGVAKVWLLGGVDGMSYKVSVTLTTAAGRIKQDEIILNLREV